MVSHFIDAILNAIGIIRVAAATSQVANNKLLRLIGPQGRRFFKLRQLVGVNF